MIPYQYRTKNLPAVNWYRYVLESTVLVVTQSRSHHSSSIYTHKHVQYCTVSGPRSGRHPLESAENLGARICWKNVHLPVNLTASLRLLPQPHKKSYGRLQYCACISLVEQYPFDGLIHILQRFASFIRDKSHNHSLPMLQKVEQLNCSYFNQHLRSDLSPLNSFVLYTLFPPLPFILSFSP